MKHLKYALAFLFGAGSLNSQAQCNVTGSHYTANYTSGWVVTDEVTSGSPISTSCGDGKNGRITLNPSLPTACIFETARNGRILRNSTNITAVSDNSWTMDFRLIITGPPSGTTLINNSPSIILAALTADNMDLRVSCPNNGLCNTCGTYAQTNTDAIYVTLVSDIPVTCNETHATQLLRNWRIEAFSREGNGTPIASAPISILSGSSANYYIRLERVSPTRAILSVCSDINYTAHYTGSPVCFDVPATVTGLDALTHAVQAQGGCNRVFNGAISGLKIDNGTTCSLPLAASFTMPTPICEGQPITVDGSATSSGSILDISSHQWSVQQCDAGGNVSGPVWTGASVAGSPGSFTFSYANMASVGISATCGYYKVKLNVTNCAGTSASQEKVIYVRCAPVADMSRMDNRICKGEQVDLDAAISGGSGNFTIQWSTTYPSSSLIYSGPPTVISVSPGVNTYYECYVYDNVTGCSSTTPWLIAVANNDPSFTITTGTIAPSYYTINLTATDLTAASSPGFSYSYEVQELDGSGMSYYTNNGVSCWQNYPGAEVFEGFVSTGTGTYTQFTGSTPCGQEGKFLYCHSYRIVRTTWNDDCPTSDYSVVMTYCDKKGFVITPDSDPEKRGEAIINGSKMEEPENQVSISPNPSTGIFTIGLAEGTDNASIEVYNELGAKVKSFDQTTRTAEMNLRNLPKGIYMVKILSEGSLITKKIILE